MSTETQTVSLDALRDVPLDNFPATLAGIAIDDVGLDGMTDEMLSCSALNTPTRRAPPLRLQPTHAATLAYGLEQTRTTATWTETR